MARLHPSDVTSLSLSLGETAELRTLDLLRRGLPDAYTVFHSVHWAVSTASNSKFGEADLVVVNRSGEIVIIEQKGGGLEETGRGLAKRYEGTAPKLVAPQINRNQEALRKQYARQTGGLLNIDYLFYCPDHHMRDRLGSELAADRIVDASEAQALPARVMALLGFGTLCQEGDRIRRFFQNAFNIVPDIHAQIREGEKAMTRLSSSGLIGAFSVSK